jgi:hypothetical protein
VAEELE